MAQSNIEVRKCDRCGEVEEMRRPEQVYAWTKIMSRQVNGPFHIGDMSKADDRCHADLCPACTAALDAWWLGGNVK